MILMAEDFRLPEVLQAHRSRQDRARHSGNTPPPANRIAAKKEAHSAFSPSEPLSFRALVIWAGLTSEAQAIAEVHDSVRVPRTL